MAEIFGIEGPCAFCLVLVLVGCCTVKRAMDEVPDKCQEEIHIYNLPPIFKDEGDPQNYRRLVSQSDLFGNFIEQSSL